MSAGFLCAMWGAAVAGLVLASACGGKSTSESEGGVVCHHGGATYRPGESFPDEDGCNTCSCGLDGMVGCTARGCAPTCMVDGVTHALGESFPAPDGCNTCFCDLGGLTCTQIDCNAGCNYGGRQYAPGESFAADDGCNSCTCAPGGPVSCTDLPCPPSDCLYLGVQRFAGESFPSRDGCNTCQCLRGGNVSCTEINCPCKPEAEWWRRYVGRSQQECAVIDFECSSYTTNFSNECGCGCEQEVRCPEYTTDTIPEFRALCPFSIIISPDPN